LDEVLIEAAREQGRIVKPDPEPGKGGFYRSDHFEFVRKGIPAVNAGAGVEFLDKPPGYGMEKRNEYTKNDYHKVTDEVKPDWDLSGLVEDAQLLFQVGWRVANNPKVPQWRPGAEFAKTRESGPTTPTGK
jgi:Zn-dependent M28 family amino/carboxypeptidase